MAKSNRSVERVREALAHHGMELDLQRFPESTRTAADAARAVGCEVAQIAKSLVFKGTHSHEPLLIVASGRNRVDLATAGEAAGEPLEMADAAFVREQTGFAIGGVPPLGHAKPIRVFIDRDLLEFEQIWAAAGAPDAVFPVSPQRLREMTGATVIEVT